MTNNKSTVELPITNIKNQNCFVSYYLKFVIQLLF